MVAGRLFSAPEAPARRCVLSRGSGLTGLVFLLCLFVTPAVCRVTVSGPELLANGGFEDLAADGRPAVGWEGFHTTDWGDCAGEAASSTTAPHAGERCLEVSGVRTLFAAVHSARVPVEFGKSYVLSGWIRTELTRGQSGFLALSWFGEDKWLSLSESSPLRGHSPWTYLELAVTPRDRPSDAVSVQVSLRIRGTGPRGKAWADELSFRECEVPAVMPDTESGSLRLLDMTRESLIQRLIWQDRLRMLDRLETDVHRLLSSHPGTFAALQAAYGEAVGAGEFLSRRQMTAEEAEDLVPREPESLRAHAAEIAEVPGLQRRCLERLETILRQKRNLDAYPERRRFFLWAQLAALRPTPTWEPESASVTVTQQFAAALETGSVESSGEMLDVLVRSQYDAAADTGLVDFSAGPLSPAPGDTVQIGVTDAGGRVVAFAQAPGAGDIAMSLSLASPNLWYPDCRYLYRFWAFLIRDGRPVDSYTQYVAFRTVQIRESDVTAAMRHAWSWAPTDFTFVVNGQPYFPRGTVCTEARSHPAEAQSLFSELWLDYQRTYGAFLASLSETQADELAAHGLTCVSAMSPHYQSVNSYLSSDGDFGGFRRAARACRWLADHPMNLAFEVGNEAELDVWGARLPASYGRDLWHAFNEAAKVLRQELAPRLPVGYVRAASYNKVHPVPREDYSGVNQYTGRYWGRRCTMTGDLAAICADATYSARPFGVTEWNGPKYSWSTGGVSGVDEEGAAEYIADYYHTMLRTPMTVLSTEFVLNWVVTPVEDLTTVSIEEGRRTRTQWKWSNQKGVPWYPAIWPDLLADTASRRAMQGFESPLWDLGNAPGEVRVCSEPAQAQVAHAIAGLLRLVGRPATVEAMPSRGDPVSAAGSVVLVGGYGARQPAAIRRLEALRVIGRTTEDFPPPGECLIQRRVNPDFPDGLLLAITAADEAGMQDALNRLTSAAGGLRELRARHATCRRALALVDDDANVARAFTRYVLELPTRSVLLGRDDLRTSLSRSELLDRQGRLDPHWADLSTLLLATSRELTPEEADLIQTLARHGLTMVWSAPTLRANPRIAADLSLTLADPVPMTGPLPVARWASRPLEVPDMGNVAAETVAKFAKIKPDSPLWQAATETATLDLGPAWKVAVTDAEGRAVVASLQADAGRHWAFGADLQGAAVALWNTNRGGIIHSTYDRDTACGLERLFRVVANATASAASPRPAETLRLRAEVITDKETYDSGDTLRATVLVRDELGSPQDASVWVSFANPKRFLEQRGKGVLWAPATRTGPGRYEILRKIVVSAGTPRLDVWPSSLDGQDCVTVTCDVTHPQMTGDWHCHTVRLAGETNEDRHLSLLAKLVSEDLLQGFLGVNDREKWIELQGAVTLPAHPRAGEPMGISVVISRVEGDEGNDWLQDTALVLTPAAGGDEVVFPLWEGKLVTGPKSSIVSKQTDRCVVVSSSTPVEQTLTWERPEPGIWQLALRYRYTDEYHIADTDRLQREDLFSGAVVRVGE